MTTEHSTYTYKNGEQETVTLKRGMADPHGHALLRITHDDGKTLDCYVNTAWLRDRLNDLGEPRPITPDSITDEMVLRFMNTYDRLSDGSKDAPTLNHFTAARTSITRSALTAALTEPPARPEGAEAAQQYLEGFLSSVEFARDIDAAWLADHLIETLNDSGVRVAKEDPR